MSLDFSTGEPRILKQVLFTFKIIELPFSYIARKQYLGWQMLGKKKKGGRPQGEKKKTKTCMLA